MTLSDNDKNKLAKSENASGKTETIGEHTTLLLEQAKRLYELGYIDEKEYRVLLYACEKHDYGKINDAMQNRLRGKHKKFNSDEEVRHNVLSALFVNPDDFNAEEDYYMALYAVLFHHDNHDSNDTWASVLRANNPLIDEFIDIYREYGIKKPCRKTLIKIDDMLELRECNSHTAEEWSFFNKLIKMKGLLHKCDYSASAHIECEYKNDFLLQKLDALLSDWKQKSEGGNEADWNALQKFAKQNCDYNMIVTAPTGSGKTEAGLLWAGDRKCFFILPLRTAINAIYERIKTDILNDENIHCRLALLHSDMQAYYFGDNDENGSMFDNEEIITYALRSKQMSLPVTVATLDQLFDFALKYYGYEYKLATLSYSKVIIDEIQMYSPDLLAYLVYGIKKIIEMGGKVAVLTATMPPFVKDKLLEVMGENVSVKDFSELGKPRHNVKVFNKKLNSKDIYIKWKELREKESRKFLVICNSVKTAQRIYSELRDLLEDENIEVHLLHGKFTGEDRKAKERAIFEVGKTFDDTGKLNNSHQIWVTTSVVEASLDIDFDYLFTELLELFSLFQRFGRVNRKGYKCIEESNCFVYTELQDAPLKCFGKDKKGFKFVDEDIYELSKEALKKVDGVLDEVTKTKLINTFLSSDNLMSTGYQSKYEKAYKYLEELYLYQEDKCPIRDIKNIDIIPYPIYQKNKERIDNDEAVLKSRGTTIDERIRAVKDIRYYTVSVNMFSINENGGKNQTKIERKVRLNRHTSIPVVDCEYNSDIGLGKIFRYDGMKIEDRMM